MMNVNLACRNSVLQIAKVARDGRCLEALCRRRNSSLASEFTKAAVTAGPTTQRPLFRTVETNPANHTGRHEGFFYTVPKADFDRWMSRGLTVQYYRALKAFNENCVMVRAPSVEVISAMKQSDFAAPAVRYIFYGRSGCGKSFSLAHVMHYAGLQGWFVAHCPWAAHYNRYYRDHQQSSFKPGRIDQPTDSVDWLAYFLKMNLPLLKPETPSGDVPRTVERYVWNKRESTEVGTPLTELIEFGTSRAKYASDVMGAILKELRLQASAGKFRLLVAVDGINAFQSQTTIVRQDDRLKFYSSNQLSMSQHWIRLMEGGWSGGAFVGTIDAMASYPYNVDRYKPVDVLGSEAFQQLDPFVPIEVPVYNDREAFSCIEYYRNRRWIQSDHGSTEDGRRQLMAVSGNHPLELYNAAIHW